MCIDNQPLNWAILLAGPLVLFLLNVVLINLYKKLRKHKWYLIIPSVVLALIWISEVYVSTLVLKC